MSEWKEYSLEEITEPIKEAYIPTGNHHPCRHTQIYFGIQYQRQPVL